MMRIEIESVELSRNRLFDDDETFHDENSQFCCQSTVNRHLTEFTMKNISSA